MLRIAGKTDVGRFRSANEDGFQVVMLSEDTAFAVLCDGMGGENGGRVASSQAVSDILKAVEEGYRKDFNENSVKHLLFSAVSSANAKVFEMANSDKDLLGMGTTVIALLARENALHIAYAGDSRVYLLTQEGIRQITTDHSMVQLMVERGEISNEEAKNHPERHYITRALGVQSSLDVDYLEELFPENAAVLLCSDGLSNYLSENEIHKIAFGSDVTLAVEQLVLRANQMGGQDNITAVLIAR